MAKIFSPNRASQSKRQTKPRQLPDLTVTISGYDPKAKGVAKLDDGRVVFVAGALKDEQVKVRPVRYTDKIIEAETINVLQSSPHRIAPMCPHFQVCGGCQTQYMATEQQLEAKQSALDEQFRRQLKLDVIPWHSPIVGDEWHYRRTARLAIWQHKEGHVDIGFRQAKSKHIVDIVECPILPAALLDSLAELKVILAKAKPINKFTQLLLHKDLQNLVVFLRVVAPVSNTERKQLAEWAQRHHIALWLEPNKQQYDAVYPNASSAQPVLHYRIGESTICFAPHHFVQVNQTVNELMVAQALDWLNVASTDVVLDLFCGAGNFSIPLARMAQKVVAVEGVDAMVEQVRVNAKLNDLTNIEAHQANLAELDLQTPPKWLQKVDKLLLDPARDGAFDIAKRIGTLAPKSILYVSCEPTTMIRDLHPMLQAGYTLTKLSLLNMFPHTSHIEAMALLEKK